MGFYEEIAPYYDAMTRFHERLPAETAMLTIWVERYQWRSAVDVACGTGLHAVILAQSGLRPVVGADVSASMLDAARAHARDMNVEVTWAQTSMQQAGETISGQYDALLCLGNSLPHLLTQTALETAVNSFYTLLNPGGTLVIQILNYRRILTEQQRIVGIHRHNTTEFIRFYDFLPDRIRFNLLTIDWKDEKLTHHLHSTRLYPYQKDELKAALTKQGFAEFVCYGNMTFHPFDELASPNLVLVARKEAA